MCTWVWHTLGYDSQQQYKRTQPSTVHEMKRVADNQVKAGVAGGIETVVKAISTHINNTKVCLIGCAVLCSITGNGKY